MFNIVTIYRKNKSFEKIADKGFADLSEDFFQMRRGKYIAVNVIAVILRKRRL